MVYIRSHCLELFLLTKSYFGVVRTDHWWTQVASTPSSLANLTKRICSRCSVLSVTCQKVAFLTVIALPFRDLVGIKFSLLTKELKDRKNPWHSRQQTLLTHTPRGGLPTSEEGIQKPKSKFPERLRAFKCWGARGQVILPLFLLGKLKEGADYAHSFIPADITRMTWSCACPGRTSGMEAARVKPEVCHPCVCLWSFPLSACLPGCLSTFNVSEYDSCIL